MEDPEARGWAVAVQPACAQQLRAQLEADGLYDGARRITRTDDGRLALPVVNGARDGALDRVLGDGTVLVRIALPAPRGADALSPREALLAALSARFGPEGIPPLLASEVPRRWEVHGDLVVLQEGAFASEDAWLATCPSLWADVAAALRVARVAVGARICPDLKRQSRVRLVLGGDGWVTHAEGGAVYEFDVTKCMFSRGNVNERMRMGAIGCAGETVVDLYAGIGYFTVPILRSGASMLHACEWNPNAVEALRRNLARNGVAERCQIHFGDNRTPELRARLRGVANRVLLGLIPSSRDGWPTAWAALNPRTGGWAHVHANVDGDTEEMNAAWAREVAREFAEGLSALNGVPWTARVGHVQRVKSYAPRIAHVVADVECRPA